MTLKINAWKKPSLIFKTHRLLSVTRVGKISVPVVDAEYATIATFSKGDLGRFERGDYLFWTAVLKTKRPWKGYYGKWSWRKIQLVLGRARPVLSPGDRFDRMRIEMKTDPNKEDRAIYKKWWYEILDKGANIKFIRPSIKKEVQRWINGHLADAKFLKRLVIGGKEAKVTKIAGNRWK